MFRKAIVLITLVSSIFIQLNVKAQILDPVSWTYSVEKINDNNYYLIYDAEIEDEYHLYSQFVEDGGPLPTEFIYNNKEGFELLGKAIEIPKPKTKYEEAFMMDVLYFEKNQKFKQKIKVTSEENFEIKGEIAYMVCNDETCVPLYKDFSFTIKMETVSEENQNNSKNNSKIQNKDTTDEDGFIAIKTKDETKITDKENSTTLSEKEKINENKDHKKKGLWSFFWIAFIGGFIAIFTPCVLPMVPMTVTFFMKDKEEKSKGQRQAIFYGFSIILIFTTIGTLIAATLGPNFNQWLSTHWLPNIFFFIIFLFFAAAFFGMFELRMPNWLINRADRQADKGGWLGPFFMAFVLVLVSFSCTAPIVGGILVMAAQGSVLYPVIGMLGFGLAFALPFTLFAMFPKWLNKLPKSGGWLNSVKVVLGFIELALGFKFLSVADQTYHWHLLDREIYLAIWIVIFTLMGLYLLGKIKFANDSEVKHISVPRLALVIVTFSFVVYLIPGMFGAPLKALSGWIPPQTTHDFDINAIVRKNIKAAGITNIKADDNKKEMCEEPKYKDFLHLPHGLEGYFDYEQGMKCAKAQNKPVFIDFTGHGCVNCRKMEEFVWADPEVLKRLRDDYIIITLYTDDKTKLPEEEWVPASISHDGKTKKTLGKKYADFQIRKFETNSQPQYVLADTDGNKLVKETKAYDNNVQNFVDFLDKGLEEFEKRNK